MYTCPHIQTQKCIYICIATIIQVYHIVEYTFMQIYIYIYTKHHNIT